MKKLLLIIVVFTFFASACNKEEDTTLTAKITWKDESNFDLPDKWKATVYKGAFSFLKDADYSNTALETKDISVNTASMDFVVQCKDYENYTIVIFHDENGNNKFDKGENYGVEFDGVDAGKGGTYDISVMY